MRRIMPWRVTRRKPPRSRRLIGGHLGPSIRVELPSRRLAGRAPGSVIEDAELAKIIPRILSGIGRWKPVVGSGGGLPFPNGGPAVPEASLVVVAGFVR